MSNAKDMTKAQFRTACEKYGFKPQLFLGYYELPGTNTQVSILNAGNRRRDQLAYLIQQQRILSKKRPNHSSD